MIVPAEGYLLIEPKEVEKQTASGIYLSDKSLDKQAIGTVTSTPKSLNDYKDLEVYYSPYAAVEIAGKILIRVEDIIAFEVPEKKEKASSAPVHPA